MNGRGPSLSKQFGRKRIDTLVFSHRHALCAAGALFAYARETQRAFLPHIRAPEPYRHDAFVVLDPQTQRNLELVENVFEGSSEGTVPGRAGPHHHPHGQAALATLGAASPCARSMRFTPARRRLPN